MSKFRKHLLQGFAVTTLMCCGTTAMADQSSLTAGDIVFLQASGDTPDTFAFSPLVNIEAGTLIHFADNSRADTTLGYSGWRIGSDNSFGEGSYAWVAPANISAGTVVSITDAAHGLGLSASGDTLLAFQGTLYAPIFIAGIGWDIADPFITTGTAGTNESYLPSSLTIGTDVMERAATGDNVGYTGATVAGTPAALRTAVNNSANWTSNNGALVAPPASLSVTGATSAPDATNTIAGYQFGMASTTYTLAPTAETADVDLSTVSFVNLTGTADSDGGNGLNQQDVSIAGGWTTAGSPTVSTAQAIEFSVTIGAGKQLDISSIKFAAQSNNAAGPQSVNFYMSTDGFASSTQLGSTLALGGTSWGSFSFDEAAVTQRTGTLSFRIVPFNAADGTQNMEFDEIWLDGVVSLLSAGVLADNSNSATTFGTADIHSYADNVSSTVTGETGVGGAGYVGTTATILDDPTGISGDVNFAWRTRNTNEVTTDTTGTGPPTGPLPWTPHPGLASDVLDLTGAALAGETYVLQMSYDPALIPGDQAVEDALALKQGIYLAWRGTAASPNTFWANAIDGNTGNTGTYHIGAWNASFNQVGDWGVDTTANVVWAVLNHNSVFAAIPEPSTFSMLILAALVLPLLRRRGK